MHLRPSRLDRALAGRATQSRLRSRLASACGQANRHAAKALGRVVAHRVERRRSDLAARLDAFSIKTESASVSFTNDKNDSMIGRVCLWRDSRWVVLKWARPQGRHATHALLVPAETPDDLSQKRWVSTSDVKLFDEDKIGVSRIGDRQQTPVPTGTCPQCRTCAIDADTFAVIDGQRVPVCESCWVENVSRKVQKSPYSSRRFRPST